MLDSKPGVYTQYQPFLHKDKIILKKVLKGVQTKRPGEVQSALLRRHLLELTQSFMIPLERYMGTLMPLQKNISPFKVLHYSAPSSISVICLILCLFATCSFSVGYYSVMAHFASRNWDTELFDKQTCVTKKWKKHYVCENFLNYDKPKKQTLTLGSSYKLFEGCYMFSVKNEIWTK